MISSESITLLKSEDYIVNSQENLLEIGRPTNLIQLWKYMSVILIISLPILSIYTHTAFVALAVFVLFFPLYKLLNSTETPVNIVFDKKSSSISIITATRISQQLLKFEEVANIKITSFEEFHDANAFNDTVSKLQYFIDIELKHKKIPILKFVNSTPEKLDVLSNELKKLLD
jgi:hypothetical protein